MKYITILSLILMSIVLTTGKHHKKKQNGLFHYASSFFPNLSQHILKLAFNRLRDDDYEDEEHDEVEYVPVVYGGGNKHKHHHHKDKKVIYKPYVVDPNYVGHSGHYVQPYGFLPPHYAGLYNNYLPPPEQTYPSHISPSFEQFNDYDLHHSLC